MSASVKVSAKRIRDSVVHKINGEFGNLHFMQRNKARSELGKQFVPVTGAPTNSNKTDKTQISKPLTAQLARWLGNWLPCNASRTQLVGVTNHSSLHSLLDFHHLILRQGIVMGSLNGLTPKILEKSPSNNIAQ
uniref:SFRICE_029136 n=1 Tax=Spodoptera frugiperda TaxID=7108 RepID=A0A2H1WNZ9_SPOFR